LFPSEDSSPAGIYTQPSSTAATPLRSFEDIYHTTVEHHADAEMFDASYSPITPTALYFPTAEGIDYPNVVQFRLMSQEYAQTDHEIVDNENVNFYTLFNNIP
jgi:hypothetical protein